MKTLLRGGGAAAIKIGTTTALVAAAAKHASAHGAHAARVAGPVAAGLTAALRPASSSPKHSLAGDTPDERARPGILA